MEKNIFKKNKSVNKIKKSSNIIFWLLRLILTPIIRQKFGFEFDYDTSKGIKRPCVILSNHQTSFDQFAVGVGFRFGINYLASDSLFRHGLQSALMSILAQPIPFSKGSKDASAITKMFSVIKQGGAIGMFVSGNASIFGEESSIKSGIGKLVKKFGVPVIIVKIRGGYNTKPRWKKKPSKGKMRAGVSRIIPLEELEKLPAAQLDEIIINELYFNEFKWNAEEKIIYNGKEKAEYLETVLFYCPECKSLESLCSQENDFFCKVCGMRVEINGTGFFERKNNAANCPDTILEWSKIQLEYMKAFNYSRYLDKPLFSDQDIRLSLVIRSKKDVLMGKGAMELYMDKIRICGNNFTIEKIKNMAVQSRNRLLIYTEDGEYTVDMTARGNGVKYMICFYHLKNITQNINDGYYGY